MLYGISMGAAAVLRGVSEYELAPDAIVLECPFDRLSTAARHRFERLHLPAFPALPLLLYWGGAQQGFDAFAHNPIDYAARDRSPTLLLSGDHDPLVTVDETRAIFDRLAGPKCLTLCGGVGHGPCFRGRADQWRGSVSDFLGRYVS